MVEEIANSFGVVDALFTLEKGATSGDRCAFGCRKAGIYECNIPFLRNKPLLGQVPSLQETPVLQQTVPVRLFL